jgi:transcriptional regulator with XRE-family HTH domain
MDVSKLGNAFRSNLKAALEEKGWSQSDLARAMKITPTQVSKYANGVCTPGLDLVERFAKALDVETLELLAEKVPV